jgi:hypothetical protein
MVSEELRKRLETRIVSKKEAAARQIDVAIRLFHEGEYESTVTLACAAEGQLGDGDESHLFPRLKGGRPKQFRDERAWVNFLNQTRDWLKHPTPQLDDTREIAQFEAWVMLVRACTKYHAAFQEESKIMEQFSLWARDRGFTAA